MMKSAKTTFVAASALLVGVALFSSCKGRTMENMEPTGDTVEVAVEEIRTEPIEVEHVDSNAVDSSLNR